MTLTKDVSNHLIEYFGDKVYRTIIPRNIRLAEAPSHGLPALKYDKNSRGALAYLALAGELSRKTEQELKQQALEEAAQVQ
jgi:chromosome partitioning protein